MSPAIDCEALLCALCLAPSTYSRNRFFQLYQDDEMRRVRRRASTLRSLVRQSIKLGREPSVRRLSEASFELTLAVPGVSYERRATLDALELSLFRYLLARLLGRPADEERCRIEAALARLAARHQ